MTLPRFAYRLGWRSLRRVVPGLSTARYKALARELGQAMLDHRITTPARAAMFIAQVAHESAGFRYTEEIASGAAYEGRRDLGNTKPGDGRRYKGRSYIQITGRSNYAQVSGALRHNFVTHPRALAQPVYAAKAAAWWFDSHGCNELCDVGDFRALTRRINGGTNGYSSRVAYYTRARAVSKYLVPKRRRP